MPKTPKTEVIVAEVVHDDRWEAVADVARKVERAAGSVLLSGDAAQVRHAAQKVERAAKVGREVEHAIREISSSVKRLEDKLPFKLITGKPHPRG